MALLNTEFYLHNYITDFGPTEAVIPIKFSADVPPSVINVFPGYTARGPSNISGSMAKSKRGRLHPRKLIISFRNGYRHSFPVGWRGDLSDIIKALSSINGDWEPVKFSLKGERFGIVPSGYLPEGTTFMNGLSSTTSFHKDITTYAFDYQTDIDDSNIRMSMKLERTPAEIYQKQQQFLRRSSAGKAAGTQLSGFHPRHFVAYSSAENHVNTSDASKIVRKIIVSDAASANIKEAGGSIADICHSIGYVGESIRNVKQWINI